MDALSATPRLFGTFLTSRWLLVSGDKFRVFLLIVELELDDLNLQLPRRHRTEELAKLAKTTKFTKKEIQLIYRGFKQVSLALVFYRSAASPLSHPRACVYMRKYITSQQRAPLVATESLICQQECPTGLVDEDNFKAIFSQFFPQGG